MNDFPAYGMLSGWSTHGELSCPVCQDQLHGAYPYYGRKSSWFDCHRCFLPRNHASRGNRTSFIKGRTVHGQPHSAYHRRWSGRRCRICRKLRMSLEFKLKDSLKISTIGQNVLFSGIFRTGNINFFGIIWMSCILRKTSVKIL